MIESIDFSYGTEVPYELEPAALCSDHRGGKKHHPRGAETLPDPAVPFAEPEGTGRGAGHPAVHPRARRAGAHLRGQPVLRLGCGDRHLLRAAERQAQRHRFRPAPAAAAGRQPPPGQSAAAHHPVGVLPAVSQLRSPHGGAFHHPAAPSAGRQTAGFHRGRAQPRHRDLLQRAAAERAHPAGRAPVVPAPHPAAERCAGAERPQRRTVHPAAAGTDAGRHLPENVRAGGLSARPAAPVQQRGARAEPGRATARHHLCTADLCPAAVLRRGAVLLPHRQSRDQPPAGPRLPPQQLPERPPQGHAGAVPHSGAEALWFILFTRAGCRGGGSVLPCRRTCGSRPA